jgi:hypothetical protein
VRCKASAVSSGQVVPHRSSIARMVEPARMLSRRTRRSPATRLGCPVIRRRDDQGTRDVLPDGLPRKGRSKIQRDTPHELTLDSPSRKSLRRGTGDVCRVAARLHRDIARSRIGCPAVASAPPPWRLKGHGQLVRDTRVTRVSGDDWGESASVRWRHTTAKQVPCHSACPVSGDDEGNVETGDCARFSRIRSDGAAPSPL